MTSDQSNANDAARHQRQANSHGLEQIEQLIDTLAGDLAPVLTDSHQACMVGIQRRGDQLARRLATRLEPLLGHELELGTLDITLYRDDFDSLTETPVVGQTDIPFSLDGRTVVLVDDVLYTGRTVRAALNELHEFGRPSRVLLVVLVDRGWRELPIAANFAGTTLETERDDNVQVFLSEVDGRDAIELFSSERLAEDE